MERRGLTLIELLAAIAIMVVVAAIALPAVENRLASAKFEAAGAQVEAAILVARAEAQRRGGMVSLIARELAGGQTGLFIEARPASDHAQDGAPAVTSGVPIVRIDGVRLSADPPAAASGARGVGTPPANRRSDKPETRPDVLIARFMPDGSAATAGPLYLIGGSDSASMVVNRWTGSATIRPAEATKTQDAAPGAEAPPEEVPPPDVEGAK